MKVSQNIQPAAGIPVSGTAFKIKGLRWYIVGLIGVATIINYIDRGAINFMWPYIYKDFGIADADSKSASGLYNHFLYGGLCHWANRYR